MLLINTQLKPSSIDGIGLFAAEQIIAGTVIGRWDVEFRWSCSEAALTALPKLAREFVNKYGWRHSDGRWQVSIDNSRFLNHSTSPNTRVESTADCPFVSIATRDIAIGEEITEDYRQFDPDFDEYGSTLNAEPTDPGVIRAAEGVVLEPGEYEVVEIATRDEDPGLTVGQRFTLRPRLEPLTRVGESIWGTRHTLPADVTADDVARAQHYAPLLNREPIAPATPRSEPNDPDVDRVSVGLRDTGIDANDRERARVALCRLQLRFRNVRVERDEALTKLADADKYMLQLLDRVKSRDATIAIGNERIRESARVERETLAKVAELTAANEGLEIDRDSARAVIAVFRQELLVCEGESATAAIRHLRTSLAAAEHQANLLRADLGELGIDQPGSCDTPEGAAAQARVDARFAAVEREQSAHRNAQLLQRESDKQASRAIDAERERDELRSGQRDLLANLEECQGDLRTERQKLRVAVEDCDHAVKTRATRTADLEPYDARTLKHAARDLRCTARICVDGRVSDSLRSFASQFEREARAITTKKKRKSAGDSSR